MKVAGFYIAYAIIWLISLLPLKVLYLLSDLAYQLVYHITGYRKRVVRDNLRNAFPEKSNEEIEVIAKKFFRHFCDFLIESIKTIHLSKKEINRRFSYKNPELFEQYYQKGQSIVLVSGHYGNWEWMVDFPSKVKYDTLAIYKPLQNEKFDRLVLNIRKKYARGSEMVAMNDIYRRILESEKAKKPIITWFLVDQTPPRNYPFRISFMNREVPFYTGPDKIAQKFGHAVVYMKIMKQKRGYYQVEFIPVSDTAPQSDEFEIVRRIVKTLENTIREQPEYWLWSHRRWKHAGKTKRQTNK